MYIKFLLVFLLSITVYAKDTLKKVYYIDSDSIKLNYIVPSNDSNITLFKLQNGFHKKKVKSSDLLKILRSYGYKDYKFRYQYVSFIKKSPIDTKKIKNKIKEYYKQNYKQINIKNIIVEPRSYMDKLQENYTIEIRSKNYLSSQGTISIKTKKRKKIFFNYIIYADVDIYISRQKIKKKTELSAINTSKKSIILDKFKATPIQIIKTSTLQSKHHISKGTILTTRDVETLSLIKKGSFISISVNNGNLDITFSAKALEDGKVNDTIRVIKSDGKKLKVKVISKNKAEIR